MAKENVHQDTLGECDLLARKLGQLEALLHGTSGESRAGFEDLSTELRDNYMWACTDLVVACRELSESISTAFLKASPVVLHVAAKA